MTNDARRRFAEDQITLVRHTRRTILRARVVIERIEGRIIGFIVTFDDVTDLLSATQSGVVRYCAANCA